MLPRVIKELRNSLVPHKFCWARVQAYENSPHFVACEQALQFGLAKWASRERANEVLRRSLARSRETRFTRPNRRACSQANILRRHHWFASEMSLRYERRNSISMTCHHPDGYIRRVFIPEDCRRTSGQTGSFTVKYDMYTSIRCNFRWFSGQI